MSDPKRLIQGSEHSLESALLRSAKREVPPARAHERMLSTLGIAGTAASAMTVAGKAAAAVAAANTKPIGAMTAAYVAKWALIGSVGALVSVGVARQVPVLVGARTHVPPSLVSNPANSDRHTEGKGALSAPAAGDVPEDRAASVTSGLPESNPRSRSGATKLNPSSKATVASSLGSEVAALDRARSAAADHDPYRTLALLDVYQRQFPNGSLAPEAQLLRIEALVQSGRRAQALPLARRLLNTASDGPLAERLRKLLPEIE